MTGTVVHEWVKIEYASRPVKMGPLAFKATFYRAVCSCGFSTAYTSAPGDMGRIMTRHALHGQMSLKM